MVRVWILLQADHILKGIRYRLCRVLGRVVKYEMALRSTMSMLTFFWLESPRHGVGEGAKDRLLGDGVNTAWCLSTGRYGQVGLDGRFPCCTIL